MANIINKVKTRYADWAKVVPQTIRTVKSAALNKKLSDRLTVTNANNERLLKGSREMFNRGEYEAGTYWGETRTFPKELKDLRRYKK